MPCTEGFFRTARTGNHVQDGYIEERSALGPVNLTVPGSGAGAGAALPLRLLDGFSLYTEGADGTEEIVSLQMLQNGRASFAQSHNLANLHVLTDASSCCLGARIFRAHLHYSQSS